MIASDSVSMLSTLAPTPPGVEACSCDEALALRRELGAARAALADKALVLERYAELRSRARPQPGARQVALEHAWHPGGGGDD